MALALRARVSFCWFLCRSLSACLPWSGVCSPGKSTVRRAKTPSSPDSAGGSVGGSGSMGTILVCPGLLRIACPERLSPQGGLSVASSARRLASSIRTPFGLHSEPSLLGTESAQGRQDDHRGRPRLRPRVFLSACLSACLLRRLRLLRAACATSRSLQLRLLRSETRLLGAESPQIRLLRLLTSDGVACVGCATCELVLRIGTTVVGRSVTS